MVNTRMFVFKHPKYYKELRERNKSDQVISNAEATAASERAPGQGLRSYPLSGNGGKLDSLQTLADKAQATSSKPQASSGKLSNQPQASSAKRQASQPE